MLTLERQYGQTVFMPAKAVTISENTRSNFYGCLNRSIYPILGDLKMPDITLANIFALLLSIQSEGKAPATVIKCYTILHSLFKMAYMADAIPKNPMDKVERPKPRKDETQTTVEACSIEELRHILQCLEQEPLKWQVLARPLMDTGIRRGECHDLK
ncbi:hypothetical protein [Oscillibacter sp.]|uniref:tyrosine-type recombinase/integrase n=1 Tax=Oscillibacter sp. TaxID=1945593 RepID=UPI0033962709